MLKKIKIHNYRSHRNTSVSFSSGITGFIGESLNGKTNILRAIKQVVLNRPSKFSKAHSNFAIKKDNETSVQLTLDCGSKVTLLKTKSNATYKLEVPGKKLQTFRKFKFSIPDLVENKLNIKDINFQNQLDSHFLVTSSGGQIAKAISKITQTDKINSWIQAIKKKISHLKSKESILEFDIEVIDKQIKSFRGMNRLGKIISELEKVQYERNKSEEEYDKIDDLNIQIQDNKRIIENSKRHLKAKPHIKQLEAVQRRLTACQQQEKLILDVKTAEDYIKIAKSIREKYIREYISILKRNKQCPTCFGKISFKTIKEIKKELLVE